MEKKSIKELAIELAVNVTELCDNVKAKAVYSNQLLRSCSSIGANAYEARYAQSRADFISKMEIALKECYETDYWLELLYRIGTLSAEQYKLVSNKCGTIRRKLISSITTAKKNS
ncbi:MAG: four helix bundle protein [Christensenellales bacterium]